MSFSDTVRQDALVKSKRRCCVCHEFAGVYTNVHHIKPKASGGTDTIDNAIVLCLRCHGEAGHYNPKHPIGNKYSPQELLRHRDEWWRSCANNPAMQLPKEPISVAPNSFPLISDGAKTKGLVKITNKADDALYDVAVKFAIRVSGIKAKDIVFDTPKREPELIHIHEGIKMSGDFIRVNAIDAAGDECIVIFIHSINPRETITLALANNSSYEPLPQTKHHVMITLLGFSSEQSVMLVKKRGAGIIFPAYEEMTLTSISLLLARN